MANQPKKYKKFVATAATATLVASAIVPVASAASLSDIAGNTHEEAINALVDAKVISGYPDGTFKPNKTLTRSDVVKLLGKYLESEGYAPAADYKESPAFNDLKRTSNEELLKYASIVKEAGVFAGSNGNLLAGDKITRENMAITLVRMINTLKDVSLEEFVAAQDFKGDVKDLNVAKAEARTAIAVLDYFDITNPSVSNFNPKGDTTRGQFATFLYKTINADFAGASATTGTVTAINATTVEVKFGKDVTAQEISAMKFTIDGLEVKNAVAKQSDKSVVVLTTSAQEAGKAYTVKLDGKKIGEFTGISAVIPTAVNIVEKSLQAPVGTQVTLKAQVTVAEGQSKAGIPVTFNIVNTAAINTATLNQPIVVEAKTDENGVATYTYTRYAETSLQIASHDEVQAYATGNPTARSFSKVYWSSIKPLSIEEVTVGNDIQNGGKKVYKVTAALNHTETVTATEYAANTAYYNAKGIYGAGQYVNIGYLENTNVAPNDAKLVKTVDVIDASGRNLGYPGQYTTSTQGTNNLNNWVKEVKIKLDNAGQAIFTLSGLDAEVTPYVFVDQKVNPLNDNGTSGRFEATELFAQAAKVTFKKLHTLNIGLQAIGEQYAAAFYNSRVSNKTLVSDGDEIANTLEGYLNRTLTAAELAAATVDAGGRDYKITIKDEKGQLAPAGTKVGIDIAIGSSQRTLGGAVYLVDNNTKKIIKLTGDAANNGKGVTFTDFNLLTTDAKGEISFTLIGYKDAYATPTVVIDSGNEQGKVDKNDQKFAGEVVFFSDARVTKAKLTGKTTATSTETVEYEFKTVDQNGKFYRPALNSLDLNNPSVNNVPVTFQVSTTFNSVDVTAGHSIISNNGYKFVNLNTNGPVTVGQDSMGNFGGIYETFTVIADEFGKASIKVTGKGLGTSVTVTASTSLASLNQLESVTTVFGSTPVASGYNGYVKNSAASYIEFEGEKLPLYYDAATAKYQLIGGTALTKAEFDAIVNKEDTKAYVQYKVDNGVAIFTILTINGVTPGNVVFTSTTQTVVNDVNTLGLVGTTATTSNAAVATASVTASGIEIKSVSPGTAVITVADTDPATTDATLNVTVSNTGAITYTTTKAGATPVGTQTVGQYVTTALNTNAMNEYAIAIPQASLTGDLAGATAVTLTVKGNTYTGTVVSGYFVFAVPTSVGTEAEVKAGILTKTN